MADDYRAWVISIINSMHITYHRDYEELIQVGMLGIADAIRKHDPKRSTFTKFASYRVRHTLIDWLRQRYAEMRDERSIDSGAVVSDLRSDLPGPYELAVTSEDRRRIRSELLKLPRKTRRVIIAYHYLEKTFKEIGHELGISRASATNIYRTGIRLLWQRLW